jgi:trehalose 6-phosphate phosphatase
MSLPTPTTGAGRAALEAALADPAVTLVALDFDGTLSPIVARPEQAFAHPDAADVLAEVAAAGYQVAIITGRPVAEVLRLGAGLAEVPRLAIYGHYGMERRIGGELTAPDEHPGVAAARRAAGDLVGDAPEGVSLEDKGHSVAVHTRNAAEPVAAFRELRPAVEAIAAEHGLEVVPGRYVLELRPAGMDKGGAMRDLVAESGVRAVVFAGDDLGDLPAVAALRSLDVAGLVVCSDSAETPAELRDTADLVVDGPSGVLGLLRELAVAAS